MTTIFATVGYRPQKVTESLRHEPDISSVVLFIGHRDNPRTAAAVEQIQKAARALAIPCRVGQAADPFDFEGCVRAYARALNPHGDAVFNISGGTGVMQAAATIVCSLKGVPMAYYNTEERRYVRMPTLRLPTIRLSRIQRGVLSALRDGPLRTSALASRVDVSPNHLAYHAGRLSASGLIEKPGKSRTGPWRLTAVGRILNA